MNWKNRLTGILALTCFSCVTLSAVAIVPDHAELMIVHGDLAGLGDFPYAVQTHIVQGGTDFICGGSIIAPNIVLTAQHCVKKFEPGWVNNTNLFSVQVVAGDLEWSFQAVASDNPNTNANKSEPPRAGSGWSQRRTVVEVVRHPGLDMSHVYNDLAILVLSHPFAFTDKVSPIGLPAQGQVFAGAGTGFGKICGWGRLRSYSHIDFSSDPTTTDVLHKASVRLYDDAFCGNYNYTTPYIYDNATMVCAGGVEADVCQGDSGGPHVVCGISSWGVRCGEGGVPGFFARVSTYTTWIQKQIAAYNETCAPEQFNCGGNVGHCISLTLACDGTRDCPNGIDELHCGRKSLFSDCTGHDYRCLDGVCLSSSKVCDKVKDCEDGSDEDGCFDEGDNEGSTTTTTRTPRMHSCNASLGVFECANGQCISDRFRCDRSKDCQDGSDEHECASHTCPDGNFQCTVGHCIPLERKCDNEYDCTDQSDELNATCWDAVCRKGSGWGAGTEYKCDRGQCLRLELYCDGDVNCVDGSDEKPSLCSGYLPQLIKVSGGLHHVTLELGTASELICYINPPKGSFLPAPPIEWLLEGKLVTDPVRLLKVNETGVASAGRPGLALLFPNVSLSDAGEYACRVRNHEYVLRVSVLEAEHEISRQNSTEPSKGRATIQTFLRPRRYVGRLSWFLALLLTMGVLLSLGGYLWKCMHPPYSRVEDDDGRRGKIRSPLNGGFEDPEQQQQDPADLRETEYGTDAEAVAAAEKAAVELNRMSYQPL